jgi:hypothetical protein
MARVVQSRKEKILLITHQKSAQEVLFVFVVALPLFGDLVELFPNNHDQKLLLDSF